MPTDKFKNLLAAMPEIAQAVNAFDSESAQLKALDAIVRAAELPSDMPQPAAYVAAPAPTDDGSVLTLVDEGNPDDSAEASKDAPTSAGPAPSTKKKSRKSPKKNFTVVRGLNFAPDGKKSLADFMAEKSPRTIHEKNLSACYYLQDVMEVTGITVGHVLAVYRECTWSSPGQPDTSLRNTAAGEGWIDTSDSKNIQVVWAGRNHVETKMPTPAPKGRK